jgi:signal transduction histidine kinase/CheY-like chemotaxis protein
MKINNLKIGTQLKIVFIIYLFLVIILGLVAYMQSHKINQKTVILYNHPFTVQRALGTLKSDIVSLHRDMKDLSLVTNEKELNVELDWIKWWKKDGFDQIKTIYNQYLGPRKDVDSLKQYFDTLCNVCDRTLEIMRSGNKSEVLNDTKTFGIVGQKVDIVQAKLQIINDFATVKGDELFTQSGQLIYSLNKQLFVLVAFILIFSLIVYIVLYRNINIPVKELTNATLRFQEGDFKGHSSYVSQNEFGILSKSFNNMVEHIKVQNEDNITKAEELGFVKGKAEQFELVNEELRKVNSDLQKALKKAEESERLKSAFLANMSHEIRTPMNGILGFAELLNDPELTGERQKEYLSIIKKSGKRMLNLINDIINISKIESGLVEMNIEVSSINELIDFVYSFFKIEAEQKGIKLSTRITLQQEDSLIKTDREKIYAILTNLIKNALKFIKSGSIEIGCSKKENFIEFYVSDTGPGISDEQKSIIFDRFRQGSESLTRNYEGFGLGLSISKAYIEMLGGKIWLESEPGKGSTFYFTLPHDNVQKEKYIIDKALEVSQVTNQIDNLKILVVEDDLTTETLISAIVEKYAKEVLIVRDGAEAILTCRNNPDIDLVLMDIKMPEMNGYEATMHIRQFNKDVIIIAQTAYALSGDREKAIEAGCNDYISKPFGKEIFAELMQRTFNK